VWWRALTGSDETLENAYLMAAGRPFPAVAFAAMPSAQHCGHRLFGGGSASTTLPQNIAPRPPSCRAYFLVLVGRAPAAGLGCQRQTPHRTKEADPVRQPLFVFISWTPNGVISPSKSGGHPPFPAQVILNGHEYGRLPSPQGRHWPSPRREIVFTDISDAAGLAKIADNPCPNKRAIGRLSQVCERWIYTTCLCFALDFEEQRRSGFRYQYSSYQIEYSRKPGL